MKILVMGGDGMLGHQLLRAWGERHEVWATLHRGPGEYPVQSWFRPDRCVFHTDVRNAQDVTDALARVKPEAVVNAIGLVKQQASAKESIPSLEINALFPHRLSQLCQVGGARLVHMSTDCVFTGRKGSYRETDIPDAEDLYGRTKLLGEVNAVHALTLRTSIVGLELARKQSLIEWYLSQRGVIQGYSKATYSGLTTAEMARVIESILLGQDPPSGLWHLSSDPISKYDLLMGLQTRLRRTNLVIERNESFECDRSLDSSALRARISYAPPTWDAMLDELAEWIQRREGSA
jgi:dTDP-4-dehydrorhamnose reductase